MVLLRTSALLVALGILLGAAGAGAGSALAQSAAPGFQTTFSANPPCVWRLSS